MTDWLSPDGFDFLKIGEPMSGRQPFFSIGDGGQSLMKDRVTQLPVWRPCNVSGDINGAFVKTKDSLDFGLWENFLRSFMLKPFSLLCFHVPLMVLALLSLLLSLLLCLDESEDLWVMLKLFSPGGVDDTNCSWQWCHNFLILFLCIHTQIPPSPATGSIRRRFYEAIVAIVAVKECSGSCVHTCMSLRNVRSESFPSLSEIPPFQRLTVVEWRRGPSSFSSKEQGKGKRIAFFVVVDLHLH